VGGGRGGVGTKDRARGGGGMKREGGGRGVGVLAWDCCRNYSGILTLVGLRDL